MSNDIATTLNSDAVAANFRQAADEMSKGGFLFAKMKKNGAWVYGIQEAAIEADEEWAVDPRQVCRGFICWKNKQVKGEHMLPVMSGRKVDETTLPDYGPYDKDGDGWREQGSIVLKSLDTGEQLQWKSTSVGGMKAISGLSGKIADKIERGSDKLIPIVTLDSDSYRHKEYGEIFFPKIEVTGWVSEAELLDAEDEEDEDEPDHVEAGEEVEPDFEETEAEQEMAKRSATKEQPRKTRRRRRTAEADDVL